MSLRRGRGGLVGGGERLADLAPEHGPARSVNSVVRRLASTDAAEHRLGFRAEIELREGLAGLVEWWRAQQAMQAQS